MDTSIPVVPIESLIDAYDVVLLDAYGVLVDADGPITGASALIAHLDRRCKPYLIVTNDASRSPEATAARYRSFGIDIPAERVLTSGALLGPHFAARGLLGAGCLVLGTDDSRRYVEAAGGVVVPIPADDPAAASVLVVADENGFPCLEGVDAALTLAYRRLDAGAPLSLILPNPDLVYPKARDRFGVAAGSIARMLEGALALRHPGRSDLVFERLGKPHRPIFDEARRRVAPAGGVPRMLMIGDQLETDIRGARAFGIDAALVTWGVTRVEALHDRLPPEVRPSYLLNSLAVTWV